MPTRTRWVDLAVPAEWLASEPDLARRMRLLWGLALTASAVALGVGLNAASAGETARFIVHLVSPIALCGACWLARRKRDLHLGTTCFCASAVVIATIHYVLSGGRLDPLTAIFLLPVVATTVSGAKRGIAWTLAGLGVVYLLDHSVLPVVPEHARLARNGMVLLALVGAALAAIESLRENAVRASMGHLEATRSKERARARAEAALAETQTLFAKAFARTPSILTVTAVDDGTILNVNDSFLEKLGHVREDVIGRTMVELGVWDDWNDRDRAILGVAKGEVSTFEFNLPGANGERLDFDATMEIVSMSGRDCLLTQAIDVTERKRLDRQLRHQRVELEARFAERGDQLEASLARLQEQQRLASIGTLAAGIAHQINNPIGGIVAASEFALAAEPGELDADEVKHAFETILDEAHRCGMIARSLLKFSRNEPTPKWADDINKIVRRAVELNRSYVTSRGGKLSLQLAPEPLIAWCSPIDLEQVFVNLVRNGSEALEEGADVTVTTRALDGFIEIAVRDNGTGVPNEDASRIFDPFFTTRLASGGTGLGLSIAHGIVSDHDGELIVESDLDDGTRIRVLLPASGGASGQA